MKSLEQVKNAALAVPEHIINDGFVLSNNPVGGDWYLYSDNNRGMGRQWLAAFPAGKHYFGGFAQFMATVDPRSILQLVARVEAAEQGMEAAITAAEARGYENGSRDTRRRAVEAARSVYEFPNGRSDDIDFARRKGVFEAAGLVAELPLHPWTREGELSGTPHA